ncbi:MAG TPA: hypothetical protein VFZ58_04645 [Candidatus Saccharimonadales bacterium]
MKPQHRRSKLLVILVVGALFLVCGGVIFILMNRAADNNLKQRGQFAKILFYDTLENAAKQQKIKVSMYRETFANAADARAHKNIGSVASSVSELDTAQGFRSVFAHNLLQDDKTFSVGRCIDGVTYNDYYQSPALKTERATTLTEAAERLALIPRGNLYQVTEPLVFIPCPHIGLLPASPPLAVARLSDGILPVTLSDEQAASWKQQLIAADLFEIKSEGLVEKDGKQLRKVSFKPKDANTSVNQRLYQIFYEAGEIAKLKAEQPNTEVDYEFQSINLNNSGAIEGYYLIDEQTKLPVYSELASSNPDKTAGSSRVAGQNIARTKQRYSFNTGLTLTLETPLEFLQ